MSTEDTLVPLVPLALVARVRAVLPRVVRSAALLVVFLVVLLVGPALAQARPAIPPGREAEIVALVAPYRPGAPIDETWSLRSINTEVSTIHLWLSGPDDARAHITLDHPDYAPAQAERTGALALTIVESPPGSEAAIQDLRAAILTADDGSFWQRRTPSGDEGEGGEEEGEGEGEEEEEGEEKGEGKRALPAMLVVEDDPDRGRFAGAGWAWIFDGTVLLLALLAALLTMLGHALAGIADRRVRARSAAILAGITVIGGGLRLALAPVVGLTAWPFVRVPLPAAKIYAGPLIALLHPGTLWLSDVVTGTTLLLALAAPLAIFLHARQLLADRRAALIAAGLCALLPLHIRFSQSDVVFVASITISSLTFALLHMAARERARAPALAAFILLGAPLALTFLVRPLNILYAPLLLAALFLREGIGEAPKPEASRRRVVALLALVLGVTALVGAPALLADYHAQVREGLRLKTIIDALGVLFSVRDNALLNPSMTPPVLPLLALAGVVGLWRRGRRRLLAFLGIWLLAFLGAHAYVIPREPLMQARYHLHLLVPFIYLASVGVLWILELTRDRAARWRPLLALAGLSVLAAPAVHLGFIRDVDLDQVDEWQWVHGQRDVIPAECTIVEFTPHNVGHRFARVGAYARAGSGHNHWNIVAYTTADELDEPPMRDLLSDPPACLYVYEGLPCAAFKELREDHDGETLATACATLHDTLDLEEIVRHERRSRPYDGNMSVGLHPGETIVFRLLRGR